MNLSHRIRRVARDLEGEGLSHGEAVEMFTTLGEIIKRHVTDPGTRHAIAEDLREVANRWPRRVRGHRLGAR
jgi:hypothetical protein